MRGGFRSLLFFLVGVLVGVLSLTLFLMVSAPKARYSMEERPKATASVPAKPALSLPSAQRLKSARAIPRRAVSLRPKTEPSAKVRPPRPLAQPPKIQIDKGGPLYVVLIGPIIDATESSEIAGKLTAAGFAAKVSRVEAPRFRVVTHPVLRKIAERRVQALRELGFTPRIQSRRGSRVVIDFGVFVRANRAESLAKRLRARGYPVKAIRESTPRHIVTVGPYTHSVADSVVKIAQTRFAVSVTPQVSKAR
jgi:cell division septation protein DedD